MHCQSAVCRQFFCLLTLACILPGGCISRDQAGSEAPAKPAPSPSRPLADSANNPDVATSQNAATTDPALPGRPGSQHELKILHWNIESGGNYPSVIASQLRDFAEARYQLLALSEVHEYQVYEDKFNALSGDGRWQSILGASGINDQREDDRLMILFDSWRLKLISSQELNRYADFRLNDGRHRSPLVAHFRDRESNQEFLLLHNHLARGNAEFREEQAGGLREFARNTSLPLIAVGDYNFDYEFESGQGNPAFNAFVRDGIWRWVEPEELIDTNWFDPEPDGIDNYPGSMLDFTFVAGPARDWATNSRVIVRDGDFPDDEQTSDHRPTEVVVRY